MKLRVIVFLLLVSSFTVKAQWTQLGTPHGLLSYTERIEGIGIIGNNTVISTNANGIFLSGNNGGTWRKPNGSFPADAHFYGSASLNGKIFFGSRAPYVGIFKSSDNGENWDTLSNGLSGGTVLLTSIKILGVFNGKLFVTGYNLFVSENDGELWQSSTKGLPPSPPNVIYAVTNIGTKYFCSVKRIYQSTDALNWDSTSNIGLPNTQITKLVTSGNTLVANAFNTGLYYSDDNGDHWTSANGLSVSDNKSVNDIIVSNGKLYASTGAYIYVSQDNGKNWLLLDASGIRPSGVTDLVATNSTLYAGIYSAPYGGFFKRVLSAASIHQIDNKIPQLFVLEQNYPNPFNPSTNIRFTIRNDGFTSLIVYDILGKGITSLVNEQLTAGSYETTFNATKLVSGIYFCRLVSGSSTQMKKMILLK
jgi:hypothetical protein